MSAHTSFTADRTAAKAIGIIASLKVMDLPSGVHYDLDRLRSEIDRITHEAKRATDYWRQEAMGMPSRNRLTRAGATHAGTAKGIGAALAREITQTIDLYAHPEVDDNGMQVSVRKAGARSPRGWVFVGRYDPGVTAEQIAEDLSA